MSCVVFEVILLSCLGTSALACEDNRFRFPGHTSCLRIRKNLRKGPGMMNGYNAAGADSQARICCNNKATEILLKILEGGWEASSMLVPYRCWY